jgi:hypothetical protein
MAAAAGSAAATDAPESSTAGPAATPTFAVAPAAGATVVWAPALLLTLLAVAAPLLRRAWALLLSLFPVRAKIASGQPGLSPPTSPARRARRRSPAGPASPPAGPAAPSPAGRHFFGLGADEAGSSEDEGEELTARELRRLEQSSEFAAWCAQGGLSRRDLEASAGRLRLYRRLRALHPASFWQLCRPDSRRGRETFEPAPAAAVGEYFASLLLTLGALGAVWYCVAARPAPVTAGALLLAAWRGAGAQWARGRPAAGRWCGAWCADVEFGHRAQGARALAAALLEAVYVVGTLGAGAAVSAAARARGGQGVGERLAGVRVVRERSVRLDQDSD